MPLFSKAGRRLFLYLNFRFFSNGIGEKNSLCHGFIDSFVLFNKNQIGSMDESKVDKILVRGAKVHNLKNIDVDIPLNKIVGIAGVSGSGKSSLALGVLYFEGSRRYLESLSTYTRRRLTQAEKSDVDDVLYVPAALALRQRPPVPGIRSTFGTSSELLNSLRLMFSRLSSHRCPNGHYVEPSINVALDRELECPICHERFYAPGAEELSFNSTGRCPHCDGTGSVRSIDRTKLVLDENLSIDEGAVLPWQSLMWSLMKDIARDKLGIRTDVPFKDLTEREKDLVFNGKPDKYHILYHNEKTNTMGEMDFTYYNAVYTVENALSHVKDEKGMKRVERFLKTEACPECGGTRLSQSARGPKINGLTLSDVTKMTLRDAISWVKSVPSSLPFEMRDMAENISESFFHNAKRLMDLGLSYLTLDRESSTLSTGERQRVQLARSVRNRTTGVLYVLDEPSIGLHPANIEGVKGVMDDLVNDGNSVILVDHDTKILSHSDWIVELGPGAGKEGGELIAEGTVDSIERNPNSKIGKFLSGASHVFDRKVLDRNSIFDFGRIHLSTDSIHTVRPLEVDLPKGRLISITGVSGSGKTTLILESLIPALEANIRAEHLPSHVKEISSSGLDSVKLIDSTPIGINIRSTVATYAEIHDDLRKLFSKTPDSKRLKYNAGDFSYNTGKLRCPVCDGTGSISLDVQFLPDVNIVCPDCHGSRYSKDAHSIKCQIGKNGESYSLPEIMDMSVEEAYSKLSIPSIIERRLKVLQDLGLGYLTLGEDTPGLSGGEAQRLKLASEMTRGQSGTLFVFDEPTIGLHPLNVKTLLEVFRRLTSQGATVVVIEHDLDVIKSSDYVVDMGPGGGDEGGRIVVQGTVEDVMSSADSITGRYLREL